MSLFAGNNIDTILAGHTADKAHGGAGHAYDNIEYNGKFISCAVAEDPFPVIQDFLDGPVMDLSQQYI